MKTELIEKKTIVKIAIPTTDGKSVAEFVEIEVPCTIDSLTGEELLGEEALKKMDQVKSRYMGLLLPTEIKDLRKSLGLTQEEICNLLQIGAKSYSRWETGKDRPSRSMNLLLRAIADGKATLGYLKSIQGPRSDWWTLAMERSYMSRESRPYTVDIKSGKGKSISCNCAENDFYEFCL
jgi:putative zinc finger/helix-turn-helix YgiT family protein